jgi:hypothetical protein
LDDASIPLPEIIEVRMNDAAQVSREYAILSVKRVLRAQIVQSGPKITTKAIITIKPITAKFFIITPKLNNRR